MPSSMLHQYLQSRNVRYLCFDHPPAYTAQEIAEKAHVSGRLFTKTVIVNIDGRLAMAVIHAADRLDLNALRTSVGASKVRLASEDEFRDAFRECELGAVPPFGNLYGMEVFLEKDIPVQRDMVFSAGNHAEIMTISYCDYESLVHPITVRMTTTEEADSRTAAA